MKLKDNMMMRKVAGTWVVVAAGTAADFGGLYAEIFGAERNILLNHACNKLVVGILQDKTNLFAYIVSFVFVRCIVTVHIHLAAVRQ